MKVCGFLSINRWNFIKSDNIVGLLDVYQEPLSWSVYVIIDVHYIVIKVRRVKFVSQPDLEALVRSQLTNYMPTIPSLKN